MIKTMKVTVEVELDQEAYDKKYGPGSEYFIKYYGPDSHGWSPEKEAKAVENYHIDYHMQSSLQAMVIDVIHEGFYDWAEKGWLKMKIDGSPMRQCCNTVESMPHKSHCEAIAGPEAPEDDSVGNHLGPSETW
jgi:hypothetical protein